jgi:predicted NUDIX family NTP pyrophosphohydrolase
VPVLSAGLLLFRRGDAEDDLQVLLAHPGGPFWARKDDGAWSVPKGEYGPDEDARAAAHREFLEEVGLAPPAGPELALGERRQPSGKRLTVWAVEGALDLTGSHSNEVTMEWPRGSGRTITFPEVDRVEWFDLATARTKLLRGQVPFLDDLVARLDGNGGSQGP